MTEKKRGFSNFLLMTHDEISAGLERAYLTFEDLERRNPDLYALVASEVDQAKHAMLSAFNFLNPKKRVANHTCNGTNFCQTCGQDMSKLRK